MGVSEDRIRGKLKLKLLLKGGETPAWCAVWVVWLVVRCPDDAARNTRSKHKHKPTLQRTTLSLKYRESVGVVGMVIYIQYPICIYQWTTTWLPCDNDNDNDNQRMGRKFKFERKKGADRMGEEEKAKKRELEFGVRGVLDYSSQGRPLAVYQSINQLVFYIYIYISLSFIYHCIINYNILLIPTTTDQTPAGSACCLKSVISIIIIIMCIMSFMSSTYLWSVVIFGRQYRVREFTSRPSPSPYCTRRRRRSRGIVD